MKYNCYVCGYHIYCEIWEALVDKVLTYQEIPQTCTLAAVSSDSTDSEGAPLGFQKSQPMACPFLHTYQWRIQNFEKGVQFQFRAAMPKVAHRGVYIALIHPREAREKNSPSFFTSGWALVAHSCFALLSST